LILTQWLFVGQAQRQAMLNRQIRVAWLSAPCRSARGRPQAKRGFADPNRQIPPSTQAFDILRPVGNTMPLLRDLVTAIRVEFVRHLHYLDWNRPLHISARTIHETTPDFDQNTLF
jgi:hypothetical protein